MHEVVRNLIRLTVVRIVVVVVCMSYVVVEPVSVAILSIDSAVWVVTFVVTSSVPTALVRIITCLPIVSAVDSVWMIVDTLLTSHDLVADPPLASCRVVLDLS